MYDKKLYLQAMGVDIWVRKDMVTAEASAAPSTWQELEGQVNTCTLCDLHQSRNNVVFGVGNKNAKIMFIGEAPGANEDLQGEPFVGRAGMLLTAMLQAIGLQQGH
jgi:uracil-DNA glycosylase